MRIQFDTEDYTWVWMSSERSDEADRQTILQDLHSSDFSSLRCQRASWYHRVVLRLYAEDAAHPGLELPKHTQLLSEAIACFDLTVRPCCFECGTIRLRLDRPA